MENTENEPQASFNSNGDVKNLRKTILKNLNHEIRTPLTSILGFSEILLEMLKDSEYEDLLVKINDAGNRLQTKLNSLIILSELENLNSNVPTRQFDICENTREIVEQFKPIASKKQLLLVFYAKQSCHIIGSPRLYGQIMENLLDNAVKFTPGGTIKVEISAIQRDGKHWAQIKVQDTGIGIADEHKNLIFEEFRQVSEGDQRNFEGFGIGLTITQKLVDIFGGEINFNSIQGKGSTFTILMPLVQNSHQANHGEMHVVSHQFGQPVLLKKFHSDQGELPILLLVEDNSINVELFTMYLRDFCHVFHAFDGYSAIKLASENSFDAVLLDIHLGIGLNGIETLKAMREIEGYQKIPMIAITGFAGNNDKEDLLEKGFSDYLAKPFDKSSLIHVIRQNLFE
jgi:CheY-like chemotaxis protein